MKTSTLKYVLAVLLLAVPRMAAIAQGTAFTYNGQLLQNGLLANGDFDIQFTVFDAASNGVAAAGPVTVSTGVTNGLLLVTLDFGAGVFTGPDRWLDIGVRTNGASTFTSVGPRQKFTASPYAIYSGQAANASAVAASSVGPTELATAGVPGAGQVLAYNGASMVWANPTGLGWSLTGNSGTTPGLDFVGTTDNQPLELRVASARALRLENAVDSVSGISSVNVIGGFSSNSVTASAAGATIAGGGYSGQVNTASADAASVGGGAGNTASGVASTIPGGFANLAAGRNSFAAGAAAHADHDGSFVWGDGSALVHSSAINAWDVLATGGVNFHTGDNPLTVSGGGVLAEPFVLSATNVPDGAVVIIDEEHPGELKLTDRPYDQRVAGVVSGAGGAHPAITMDEHAVLGGSKSIALSGRVFVLVDAGRGKIKPGDLLTTASTPGYAMKATNRTRARGAILGKAMTGLSGGRGTILMLVTLQ